MAGVRQGLHSHGPEVRALLQGGMVAQETRMLTNVYEKARRAYNAVFNIERPMSSVDITEECVRAVMDVTIDACAQVASDRDCGRCGYGEPESKRNAILALKTVKPSGR